MKKANKEYNLLAKNPKLCEEWDYDKNKIGPENYTPGSSREVWWKCKNGHSWCSSPNRRSKSGCPFCSGRRVTEYNSLYKNNPKLCKEWDYDKNKLDPKCVGKNSGKKIWWKCKKGHSWKATICNRNKGSGCPYCSGKKPTKHNNLLKVNPKLCEEWDYDKNKIGPENYLAKSGKSVWWRCKKGHSWKATINDRNINGCPFCSNKKICSDNCILNTNPKLCEEWDYDKNIISPKEVSFGSSKKVWWKCKNGHSWEAIVAKRKTRGCPKCSKMVSEPSTKWLDGLGILIREKTIKCENKKFIVDGFYANVIYEFLGDYWHGNPSLFDPNIINKNNNATFGELLIKTINKFNFLVKMFPIVYRWEKNKDIFRYKFIDADDNYIIKKAEHIFNNNKKCNILETLS